MKAKKIITGVAQGLLSTLLIAGIMKVITPYEELIAQMPWAEDLSPTIVMLIGVLEVLGVIGMNLPFILKKYMKLVPIAAGGLALTMLVAVLTHLLRGESFIVPLVIFAIASFVTYSRAQLLKVNEIQTVSE